MAQVALDGTVGASGPLAGPNYAITADLGQRMGPNLFLSFSQFNLVQGETAAFSGPDEVQNIISRVTGGSASSIDGTIRSTIPGANFYLLNPAGVMFGPNASVDVSGSFAASTADYVKLGEGGRFDAKTPGASVLTSAPIEAFGFLGPNVAGIKIEASKLSVSEGKTLSMVGGDVEIKAGDVTVVAERVFLGREGEIHATTFGAGAAGKVDVTTTELVMDSRTADPALQQYATSISSSTEINSGDKNPASHPFGNGGSVRVVADRIEMIGDRASITAESRTTGFGGEVRVTAGTLSLSEGAHVSSESISSGDSGRVLVDVKGAILLSGQSSISAAATVANANGVTVRSGSLIGLNQSSITAQAAKNGGELRLEAPSHISLVNSKITSAAGKDGGNIFIDPQLVTLNHSQITANAILGNGGNIRIATDFLISSADSSITASSEFGLNGQISVLGPSVDLTGSLMTLSGSLLGAEARLPEHCGIKLGGNLSSFLVLGRGGLPVQPDGWQPSSGSKQTTEDRDRP